MQCKSLEHISKQIKAYKFREMIIPDITTLDKKKSRPKRTVKINTKEAQCFYVEQIAKETVEMLLRIPQMPRNSPKTELIREKKHN